jgi:anti-sigma regulatory factor (Ser/Thr protein kinase)
MADIISRKDIAQKIHEETGVDREDAERVLRSLGPVLADALAKGREVRFPRLARFLVRGRESADPGAGGRDVVAQVSKLFREKVLGPSVSRVLTLLPAESAEVFGVLERLEGDGLCRLTRVADLDGLEKAMKGGDFDVVVVGEQVSTPEYRYLAHEIKLHPDRTRTVLLRIVPRDADPYTVDTLTIIPDEIIEWPMDADELEPLIRAQFSQAREDAEEYLQQLAIRIPSKEGMTEAVMEVLDRLGGLTPLGDRRAAELIPAVREAVESAIHVGNEGDAGKFVDVTILVDDEKIAVVVKDEGATPLSRDEWASARERSGMASMIMKKGADDVEYLPPGNRVMLTKYY